MSRKIVLLLVLVSLLVLPSCKTEDNDPLTNNIDNYIETVMQRYGIPGAGLAVVKDGEILYRTCYGTANIEFNIPVDSSVLFQLSSLTKIFTSVAVFQLVEKKKLSLEDNISAYLDDLPANWKKVKIKHLLTHTSGLPEIAVYDKLPEDEAKAKVYSDAIRFIPGERNRYTNTNFWLLKRIVEKVTRSSLKEFILKEQFMSSYSSAVYAGNYYDIVQRRATSYEPDDEGVFRLRKYEFPEYLYGAAGLNITLNDFFLWNRRLDNNELLNEITKSLMWSAYTLNNNERSDFVYGWNIRTPNNRLSIGFSGGYSTAFRKYTEDDLTIILLTNGYRYSYNIEGVVENLAGLIDDDLANNESQIYESLLNSILSGKKEVNSKRYDELRKSYPEIELEIIFNSIGYDLINLNEMEKAKDIFNINVKQNPDSWNAFDSLGEAYEIFGDIANAIANYERSVLLNPDNEHAKNKISLLQKRD